MEILKSKEIAQMAFSNGPGNRAFRTPIRDAFEKLKVGEGVVFTLDEWHEHYKSLPNGVTYWGKKMGWKISIRKDRGASKNIYVIQRMS